MSKKIADASALAERQRLEPLRRSLESIDSRPTLPRTHFYYSRVCGINQLAKEACIVIQR